MNEDNALISNPSHWKEELDSIIGKIKGTVSVFVADIEGRESYRLNEKTVYPAASVIKLPLMIVLYHLHEKGQVDLSKRLIYSEKELELVGTKGSGILQYMAPGLNPTIKDLIYLSIIVSDNVATNMLMDLVGIERANEVISSLGFEATRFVTKIGDYEAMAEGHDNLINAEEIGKMLLALAKGELVSERASREMVGILIHQQFKRLGMKLPREVDVASKTGLLRGIRHDAGIIFAKRPFVACVLGRFLEDPDSVPDLMAEMGLSCFRHFDA